MRHPTYAMFLTLTPARKDVYEHFYGRVRSNSIALKSDRSVLLETEDSPKAPRAALLLEPCITNDPVNFSYSAARKSDRQRGSIEE